LIYRTAVVGLHSGESFGTQTKFTLGMRNQNVIKNMKLQKRKKMRIMRKQLRGNKQMKNS